jgi:hypothetical protein
MNRNRGLFLLATAVTWMIADIRISASAELDQQHLVNPVTFSFAVQGGGGRGQTFTVGRSGIFERLELQVWRAVRPYFYNLDIELRTTLPTGVPNLGADGLLASLTLTPSMTPASSSPVSAFTGLDLGNKAFPVTIGQTLAIVLNNDAPSSDNWYLWATASSSTYGDGQSWAMLSSTEAVAQPIYDHGFRTYVGVPEPVGSTAMLIAIAWALETVRRSSGAPTTLNREINGDK